MIGLREARLGNTGELSSGRTAQAAPAPSDQESLAITCSPSSGLGARSDRCERRRLANDSTAHERRDTAVLDSSVPETKRYGLVCFQDRPATRVTAALADSSPWSG